MSKLTLQQQEIMDKNIEEMSFLSHNLSFLITDGRINANTLAATLVIAAISTQDFKPLGAFTELSTTDIMDLIGVKSPSVIYKIIASAEKEGLIDVVRKKGLTSKYSVRPYACK